MKIIETKQYYYSLIMQCIRRDNTTPELFNTTYTTRRTQQLMHPDLNRDTVSIIPMHQALMKSY
jgi:hypothetical protein